MGDGYGGNVGFTYKGLSVDGFYTRENGAVSLSNTINVNSAVPFQDPSVTCGAANPNCTYLKGTITNNEAWDIMAKYTFDVPGFLGWGSPASLKDAPCGGLKDAPCPLPAKVTIFGGFQQATLSNPDQAQQFYNGFATIGGYRYLTNSGAASVTNNYVYFPGSEKLLDTAWAGAKYQEGPWSFTGAWYYWSQGAYLTSNTAANADGTIKGSCLGATRANIVSKAGNTFVGSVTGGNCSGDLNEVSFLVDYAFNKHLDIYSGVTWSEINGGLASGFLENTNTTVATGLRLRW